MTALEIDWGSIMVFVKRFVRFTAALCLVATSGAAQTPLSQAPPSPTAGPAIDGVLAAFKTHPLVGMADYHGLAQEEDFYAALVRDPRFAREAGNVVVEFGGAAHQDIIDRYVAGETVSHTELRKVWTDVVGWSATTVTFAGYMNFYAQVRAANRALPARQRIHVWLGEPPIDWSKIKSKADWLAILRLRDQHAADVIDREILARHRKALVIYGTSHFYSDDSDGPLKQLRQLVEQDHPDAFFLVTPYTGFNEKSCAADFERSIQDWPVPALATPVRGTSLEAAFHRPGCHVNPSSGNGAASALARKEDESSGVAGDALLFLGPAAGLTFSPLAPDIYQDGAYRHEISRRREIVVGHPLAPSEFGGNPETPRPIRP